MKRISGLALLVFLFAAAPSYAGQARLYACHGPNGQGLGSEPIYKASVFDVTFGGGCTLPGSALTGTFTRDDPNGQSEAKLILPVPPNVTLTAVTLDRKASGPGYYAGTFESESTGNVLDGVVTYPASGGTVALGLRCAAGLTERCSGLAAARLELRMAALTVTDDTKPQFAVGGYRSPAQGVLDLDVAAQDAGLGLRSAAATFDGLPVAGASFGGCVELSPSDATVDLALGGDDCVHVGRAAMAVDTTTVANGMHTLAVSVTDAAGNTQTQSFELEVFNVVATATATATATPTVTPTATPTASPEATASPAPTVIGATATATPTPTSTPVPAAKPRAPRTGDLVRLPKRVSRKGVYTVSVLCPTTALRPCAHRLTLKAQGKTIASGRGTSKAGRRAQIALKLTSGARRSLQRRGSLTATLTLSGAAPTTVRLRG